MGTSNSFDRRPARRSAAWRRARPDAPLSFAVHDCKRRQPASHQRLAAASIGALCAAFVRRGTTGLTLVAAAFFAAAAAAAAAAETAQTGDSAPWVAYVYNDAQIIVSHGGEDYLSLNVVAWGPRWAYTGLHAAGRTDGDVAVQTLTGKLSGTEATIAIEIRAARRGPHGLQIDYELRTDRDADLTYIVVALSPGKTFEGREATALAGGRSTAIPCPFARRGLGERVERIQMTDAADRVTTVTLDPPADIPSDGDARIVLAKDRLRADTVQRLTLLVDLPGPIDWYPSVAHMPDEPGIDRWYPWQATGDSEASAIGLEDWIDRPAGQHGRIVREDQRLMYNGQPIKLWGVNLCYQACAPEKALADRRAAFYRKYGINSVRLHKYADGSGWAGILAPDSFVSFDPEALDRMDYLVAKLKEAGIYVALSAHFGSQKLGPADKQYVPYLDEFGPSRGGGGRVETPHSAVHYARELQDVQILQTVRLLQHVNPYTGLTYAQDPVIAFVEIINEQSILFYSSMAPLKASPTIRARIGRRFCDWLRKKYGDEASLIAAWGERAFDSFVDEGFAAGERLDRDNILPLGNPWFWDPDQLRGSQAFRRQRLLDSLEFLYELQCAFYDRYTAAVRAAGYDGELIGSNWQAGRAYSHFANLHSDYRVGTIDRHNYFGAGRTSDTMLARAGSGILSSGMQQVADRPFMMSEWMHVFPNEHGVEGPAILGAYGLGLQGWDASYIFQNGDHGTFLDRLGRSQWEPTAPQVWGLFPAVARQILRGDVQESSVTAVRNVHLPSVFAGRLSFDDTMAQGYDDKELDSSQVSARTLAVARSVVAFSDRYAETPTFDLAPYERGRRLVSSTGQLQWRERDAESGGFFTLASPGTAAVVGWAAGQRCDLGPVTIEIASPFAAVYVTAREPCATLESARKLLIVALGRARNTGMKFSPAGDRMVARGDAPILIEPIRARIWLRRPGAGQVLLLDHDGRPTDQVSRLDGGELTIDGARDRTPYCLVRY